MKIINFYDGIKKVYSVYAEDIADVKNNPQGYYDKYSQDLIITDVEYSNPILENGKLREMTREEMVEEMVEEDIEVSLAQGEYIENKKLITVPQPTSYHTWNTSTHTWDIDMEDVKRTFRHKFREVLLDKMFGSYEHNGKIFQMQEFDEVNFMRVKMALDMAGEIEDYEVIKEALDTLGIPVDAELEERIKMAMKAGKLKPILKLLPTQWRLKDNSIASISLGELNLIYFSWILRVIAAQNKYTAITKKIREVTTVKELEAIKWD